MSLPAIPIEELRCDCSDLATYAIQSSIYVDIAYFIIPLIVSVTIGFLFIRKLPMPLAWIGASVLFGIITWIYIAHFGSFDQGVDCILYCAEGSYYENWQAFRDFTSSIMIATLFFTQASFLIGVFLAVKQYYGMFATKVKG